MLGVAEIGQPLSSSVPRSANMAFIFRMTQIRPACSFQHPCKFTGQFVGKSLGASASESRKPAGEVCHKHITLQLPLTIFVRLERLPSRDKLTPRRTDDRAGSTPLVRRWDVEMRAVKFAGTAVAVVIIVIALLLVIGIPSGF